MRLLKMPQDAATLRELLKKTEYAGLLVPNPQEAQFESAIAAACELGIPTIQTTPYFAERLLKRLDGVGIDVSVQLAMVTGMEIPGPLRVKMCRELIEAGVKQVNLGIDRGWIGDCKYDAIRNEFKAVAEIAHEHDCQLAATLEVGSLTDEQKLKLAGQAVEAGVDAIRICSGTDLLSGINNGRATYREICLIAKTFAGSVKIKAGGGWDFAYAEDCLEQINCGATTVDVGDCFVEQLKALGYRREA